MQQIKVFPDHMSSGLWDAKDHLSLDADQFFPEVLDQADILALNYWHEIWEFFISEGIASDAYIQKWNGDGQALVNKWNIQQNLVEFIYQPEDEA